MKNILILALTALMALASCTKDDKTLEGRWNGAPGGSVGDNYAFCAVFKGDNLTLYVVPWGRRLEGTYTYGDNTIHFDIKKGYQAYTNVTFDEHGNMKSYSWSIQDGPDTPPNFDSKTLKLAAGYNWYEVDANTLKADKESFSSFKFEIVSKGKAESDLVHNPVFIKE
jgi:hypothetical protein